LAIAFDILERRNESVYAGNVVQFVMPSREFHWPLFFIAGITIVDIHFESL